MVVFEQGHALIVGVGADLPNTANDAVGLASVLKDPARCAYPPHQVHLLTEGGATRDAVLSIFDTLAQSTNSHSTVIVYFSGHGGRALENGVWRNYLCPREADPDNLAQTAVPGDEFSALLATIPARKLLVMLDACHAGGSAELKAADGTVVWKAGLPDGYYETLSQGSGRVVITSICSEPYFPWATFSHAAQVRWRTTRLSDCPAWMAWTIRL